MASLSEEVSFCLGVGNVILSTFIMSSQPWNYFLYHCFKNLLMLVFRFHTWKKKKWHYFLLEFCYVVNYWTLVYFAICLLKKHVDALEFLNQFNWLGYHVFRLAFSWSMVTSLSVAFFRNAMIFHSIEHMTILAVHVGPPLTCYGMRWYWSQVQQQWPDTFHVDIDRAETYSDQVTNLFIVPSVLYVLMWTVPYMFVMFGLKAKKIEDNGYATMFLHMGIPFVEKIGRGKIPKHYYPVVYMIAHGVLSIVAFAGSLWLWNSFWLHTLYLLVLISISVWNGSTYYFRVFTKKQMKAIEKVEAEAAAVAAATMVAVITDGANTDADATAVDDHESLRRSSRKSKNYTRSV